MTGIRKREMDFLTSETSYWAEEGIISQEQAGEILALYEVSEHSLTRILLIAGGILLGLGFVSFIAAHWHTLGKFFRVCVISAGYAASLGAYALTGRSTTRTGRALLLLAGLIFGSGIYLITRMYNIKLEFSEVLGWWLVYLLTATFIAADEWQMYFSQAVGLVWLNWINAIDIFALEFMGSARVSLSEFFTPLEGFGMIIALWIVSRRVKARTAFNANLLLTLLLVASRMSLCFGGTWTLIILACAGSLMSFARSAGRFAPVFSSFNDAEVIGLLLAGLCGLVLTWPEVWRDGFASYASVWAIVSAVLTACVMLVNIWRGHVACGIVFCVMLVVRYFFDRLFGYMPKAWGFGLAGLAFVIAGIYFGHKPRQEEE